MRAFVSKVPTTSGGTAVGVLWKQGRRQVGMEYIGSAHSEAEIALLVAAAWEVVHAGQDPLVADAVPVAAGDPGRPRVQVLGTTSAVLWDTLDQVWAQLGFAAAVSDEAFKALALARVIEPTSKLDSARVLGEVGAWAPTNTTIYRCLRRCQERGYRDRLAAACWDHAGARASLFLYDVTVRHEALVVRVEVRDLHRGFLPWQGLGSWGQPGRGDARCGWEQPRQSRVGSALSDGVGAASEDEEVYARNQRYHLS